MFENSDVVANPSLGLNVSNYIQDCLLKLVSEIFH